MNHPTTRFHPILSLLLALTMTTGSLAVFARAAAAGGIAARPRSIAPAQGPSFSNCSGTVTPPTCTNLQVFLLIDDSSSMLYSDRTRQRLEGVKNVLDILAQEHFLPAVDANAKDPSIQLPNIQVSLIRFSSAVRHNSGWKTINPGSIEEWAGQLEAFDGDLEVKIDYTQPQATDFRTAFQAAAELAADQPQTPDCPRLVMLFTDGVPNLGDGNLDDKDGKLTQYMQELQGIIQPAFGRNNDLLYVTAFGSDATFRKFWDRVYRQKWQDITKDSDMLDPRRVLYVPAQELAPRMERIIGPTIGNQVYTLTPTAGEPQKYTTEIPVAAESLRVTYYTINPTSSYKVTGPDGNIIQPDGKNAILTGENSSIQVLEILNPAPGSYQITTTAPGGLLTQLLRFERITAKLSSPIDSWLQFTNGQIGIQLLGADGKPLAISPQMSIQAALTEAGQFHNLDLSAGSDTFTLNWMPLTAGTATVEACATLKDSNGKTVVLYNGPVGEIKIDPVTVKAGEAEKACVPSDKDSSVPLQLINGRSQQPADIDVPVQWTSSLATFPTPAQLSGPIDAIDAGSGKYILRFRPTAPGDVQFAVTAGAIVDGVHYPFYSDKLAPISIQPPRPLGLTLGSPDTLGDRLSIMLYRWFHPSCIPDGTQIVYGRHVFDWFGPTQVQINGRFMDTQINAYEPDIERFAVKLVSSDGGPPSKTLSSWTAPETGADLSTLALRSPGLGLYSVTVTDQGKNADCTVLGSLPTQPVLLINDFWEYLIILIPILFLTLLVLFLLRRYRKRGLRKEVLLILSCIALVMLNVYLVNQLVKHTFECELNCGYLIDRTLQTDGSPLSLCKGVAIPFTPLELIPEMALGPLTIPGLRIGPFTIIPEITLGPVEFPGITIPEGILPIVPALANVIDPPLEGLRQLIAWSIILFFALASVLLAYVARLLLTPEGRRVVLTNLSIFLVFFVILSAVVFIQVVR